jgi:ubiquinone/menaquinone biosynthesis C-methylase UbiE
MDMTTHNHKDLVVAQFGPQAAAYVTSQVHAHGEDLQQLAAFVAGNPAARALDMGCGGGHVSFNLAPHMAEVVAYDMSVDMLAAVAQAASERGIRNIVTRQGVAEQLPFPDASFDFVISRYSAHHWHDVAAGLAEARRVLKTGGRAAFADVVAPLNPMVDTHLQSIELLRDTSHVRDYSPDEWRQKLIDAGFVPGQVTMRRLHIDFASWIARMRTPDLYVLAIRALQAGAPHEVADYLEFEPDGSFTMDSMVIEAG